MNTKKETGLMITNSTPADQSPSWPSSDVWLPRLLRLLDEQLADANRLRACSLAQAPLAAAGDVDGVSAVLDERELIIDVMAARSEDLAPFVRELATLLRQVAPRYQDLISEKIKTLEVITQLVQQQDEIDLAMVEHTRDRLSSEIAGVARGRSALAAYGRTDQGEAGGPMYQNREA